MASTEWTCFRCAYINGGTRRACEMCYSGRQNMTEQKSTLEHGSRRPVGDCWTCDYYNVQSTEGKNNSISQDTTPKRFSFETAQAPANASTGVLGGTTCISFNLTPPRDTTSQVLQKGSSQQVTVTSSPSQTQEGCLSPTKGDDDTDLIRTRKEIKELEKQLEAKRRSEKKNIQQAKLLNIRARLQQCDNPQYESRRGTGISSLDRSTNTGLNSQNNRRNILNIPSGHREQTFPIVIYPPADDSLLPAKAKEDDDTELISTRKEIQELEKQIEAKTRRSEEKHILQAKSHNIRARLQQCDNPQYDSRRDTGISPLDRSTNTGLDSQNNRQNTLNIPSGHREQTFPIVIYPAVEWVCSTCTQQNPDTARLYDDCRSPRPKHVRRRTSDPNSILPMPFFGDSIASTTSTTDFSIDMSQLDKDLEDVEISEITNPSVGNSQWNCIYCTRLNADETCVCQKCRKVRTYVQDSDANDTIMSPEDEYIAPLNEREHRNEAPGIILSSENQATRELKLVMIGPTGTGKSTTGNTILGKDEFRANISAVSVTEKTKLCKSYRYGRLVSIADTPGIFDTNVDNEYITHEILKCIGLTAPGPHAFLLVVNVSVRFSYENQESMKFFVSHFGNDLFHYLIIVFTRKDELERHNITIEKYLETIPKELEAILARCSNRYIAFNNVADNFQKHRQVKDLFQMIDHMIQQNKGQYYTNELYNETDKKIRKRMTKIYRRLEEERMLRIQNIRKGQSALIQKKYKQIVMEKEKATGRKLSQSECSELHKSAITEMKIVMQRKIDDVDSKLKPLMQNSMLRSTAQKEIQDEKPGSMALLKKGALKFLKVARLGVAGVIASPFLILGAIGKCLGEAAEPFNEMLSMEASDVLACDSSEEDT